MIKCVEGTRLIITPERRRHLSSLSGPLFASSSAPTTTGHFFRRAGCPGRHHDIIPYQESPKPAFYREWARPQGLVDHVCAVIEKSNTSAALFGVFRHERDGLVDDDVRRRMRLITPHVRRAVLIGKDRSQDRRGGDLRRHSRGWPHRRALVDATGRIIHANTTGHAILREGDFLSAIGGRLVAGDPQIDRLFRDIFTAAGNRVMRRSASKGRGAS